MEKQLEKEIAAVTKEAMDWLFNLAPSEQPLSKGNFSAAVKVKRAFGGVVYACVTTIAADVAATDWAFVDANGDTIETDNDIYSKFQNMNSIYPSFYDMLEMTQIFLEMTGNAYWYFEKTRGGRYTGKIYLIPSQYLKPVPLQDSIGVSHYRVTGLRGVKRFEVDEIVHFKYPNPNDMYVGMGTLDAALLEIDIHKFSKEYLLNFFKNGAVPAGFLTTNEKISPTDANRIETIWNTKYQGVDSAGSVAVLWGGFKYESIATDPSNVKYIEQANWTRSDIAAIFKVPLSKLGIVTDVNRANADANDSTYWANCISPKLSRIERKINDEVLPKLGINAKFKFAEVVREDVQAQFERERVNLSKAQIGATLGVLSLDEIRELLGFEGSVSDIETIDPENLTAMVNAIKGLSEL